MTTFTDAEWSAMAQAMDAYHDNQLDDIDSGADEDGEYLDACSVCLFAVCDTHNLDEVASIEPLLSAVDNALDTPDAFEDLDVAALASALPKLEALAEYYDA